MAFKLSKGDQQRRDDYVAELHKRAGKVQDAVTEYNSAVEAAKAAVESALAEYNETLAEAKGFAEDIVSQAEGEFDDKSERWQEGERGEQAREWIDAWTEVDFEDMSVDYPDEMSDFEPDHADTLEGLPVAAGE